MALWPQGRRGHTHWDVLSRPSVAVTDGQKMTRLAHLRKQNTEIDADCSHRDKDGGWQSGGCGCTRRGDMRGRGWIPKAAFTCENGLGVSQRQNIWQVQEMATPGWDYNSKLGEKERNLGSMSHFSLRFLSSLTSSTNISRYWNLFYLTHSLKLPVRLRKVQLLPFHINLFLQRAWNSFFFSHM